MLIGLDPGTTTGLAVATDAGELVQVTSCGIIAAMDIVTLYAPDVLVVFEDARQRTWFGKMDAKQAKYGAAVREGAGAAKRDAAIWEEFLQARGIAYRAVRPAKGATKWDADKFRRITGWAARTNEHGRDAACLVVGMKRQQ